MIVTQEVTGHDKGGLDDLCLGPWIEPQYFVGSDWNMVGSEKYRKLAPSVWSDDVCLQYRYQRDIYGLMF